MFTHLHNHSDGSTPISHDGLGKVETLVSTAKSKGFNALALTDHGNLLNTPSFIHAAKLNDIKPIVGLEAYVEHSGVGGFHLTLLADGNEGFNTLVNLNNIAQNNYVKRRPTFKLTDFEKHNQGLIVLTGCPASPLQELDYPEAKSIGLMLKGIFGSRLFAEMMFVGMDSQLERAVKLANDLKLKMVVTNDSHFPNAEDAKAHEILTSMHGGYDYPSEYLFLAKLDELEQRVKCIAPNYQQHFIEGAKNAYLIGQKIKQVTFDKQLSLPKIDNVDQIIYDLMLSGSVKRFGVNVNNPEIQQRLNYEYEIIKKLGFCAYFYILNDMVSYAKSIGVKVGAGRGSGAGSLILYVLGITDVNPLEYDLKFERFINEKRLDFPDVDIDYDSKGRYAVIEYAKERWHGIPVATYSRYSSASLVNDLAKYFNIPREDVEEVKKLGFDDKGNVTDVYEKFMSDKPDFDDCYNKINGQIRHIGVHAGGIVITDKNIPMIRTKVDKNGEGGQIVSSWTEGLHSKELSEMGIVKFDILGITNLDVLAELEVKHGQPIPPTDNHPIFELFCTGDTLGIFQFQTDSFTNYTKQVQPSKFVDLAAINALCRPGALGGVANHYVEYKKNGQRLLHPLIDSILAETYGVIAYQEQFMSIYAKVCDLDFGDADIARKTITKKPKGFNAEWQAKFDKLTKTFMDGCKNKGIDEKLGKMIWHEIEAHGNYSFNKTHAIAYSMIAWQLAYYKYYYRADFYAASLNAVEDKDKIKFNLFDVIKSGIEIVAPDVNTSTDQYVSDGTKIYMPLTAIKGISDAGYDAILTNKPYHSYSDFVNRVPKKKVNKRGKKALYAIGAMQTLDGDYTLLDIDAIEQKTIGEIQHEYLGFTLPLPSFFEAVKQAQSKGLVAGIITEVEEKETKVKKRKYVRYHLYPNKTVRSYRVLDLPLGKEVQFVCKHDEYGYEMLSVTNLEYN